MVSFEPDRRLAPPVRYGRLLLAFASRPFALLGFLALLVLTSGSPLEAQATSVTETTRLRTQPEGPSIGELRPGAGVDVLEVRNGWSLVVVEGSVWLRAMQVDRREGFDLVISETEGENLRDEPGGSVVGRLLYGTLLEELGRTPGWGRVRRSAWVRSDHLAAVADAGPAGSGAPGSAEGDEAGDASEAAGGLAAEGASEGALPRLALDAETDLHAGPGGAAVGRLWGGSVVRAVESEGEWTRVTVDAWVRTPGRSVGDAASTPTPAPGEPVMTDASVAEIQADSTRFLGRTVQLDLEFLSLERAEPLRRDFREGEPFLLARTPGSGRRHFVYVAVPLSRVGEVEGMAPLEPLRVTGRIRSAAAAFTGNLVLDLVEIERRR